MEVSNRRVLVFGQFDQLCETDVYGVFRMLQAVGNERNQVATLSHPNTSCEDADLMSTKPVGGLYFVLIDAGVVLSIINLEVANKGWLKLASLFLY